MARKLTADAVDALTASDVDKARTIIAADRAIDEMQQIIEQKAVLAIAKNQPMAIDLRVLVAAMRVANDLERIGDLAKNIAKRTIAIDEPPALAEADDRLRPAEQAGHRPDRTTCSLPMPPATPHWPPMWREKDSDVDAIHTSVLSASF